MGEVSKFNQLYFPQYYLTIKAFQRKVIITIPPTAFFVVMREWDFSFQKDKTLAQIREEQYIGLLIKLLQTTDDNKSAFTRVD